MQCSPSPVILQTAEPNGELSPATQGGIVRAAVGGRRYFLGGRGVIVRDRLGERDWWSPVTTLALLVSRFRRRWGARQTHTD